MRRETSVLIILIIVLSVGFTIISLALYNQINELNDEVADLQHNNEEYEKYVAEFENLASTLRWEKESVELELEQSRNTTRPILESNLIEIASLRELLATKTSNFTSLEKILDNTTRLLDGLIKELQKMEEVDEERDEQIMSLRAEKLDGQITSSLQPLHNITFNLANPSCYQCHLEMLFEANHTAHLTNPMMNFVCLKCHEDINLGLQDTTFEFGVNQTECAQCHTPMPDKIGMWQQNSDEFVKDYPECISCHSLWKSQMRKVADYINLDKIREADCYDCHGKVKLFEQTKQRITIPCVQCHG